MEIQQLLAEMAELDQEFNPVKEQPIHNHNGNGVRRSKLRQRTTGLNKIEKLMQKSKEELATTIIEFLKQISELNKVNKLQEKEINRLKEFQIINQNFEECQNNILKTNQYLKSQYETIQERFQHEGRKHKILLQENIRNIEERDGKLAILLSQIKSLKDQKQNVQAKLEHDQKQIKDLKEEIQKLKISLEDQIFRSQNILNQSQCLEIQTQQDRKKLQQVSKLFEDLQEMTGIPLATKFQDQQAKNILTELMMRSICLPGSLILRKQKLKSVQFLHKSILNILDISSYKTKLLYRYDPLNEVNFHQYFDQQQNLLLLVKTVTGTFVGGFTCFPFDKKNTKKPGNGFLFNLNHQKVFTRKADPKTAVASYDPFYLILGNSELRIKKGEKKLFSNFGIANASFEDRSFSRVDFLGIKEGNQVQFETFDIYALQIPQTLKR